MGKKRMTTLGGEDETAQKAKKAVKLEQKKLREGKSVSKPSISETVEASPSLDVTSEPETKSTSKKPVRIRSQKYKELKAKVNAENFYPVAEGLSLLRTISLTKFDPTVELHITLKDKLTSKEVEMPHSTGKTKRIVIADDEFVASLESGKPDLNLDVLLATPAQMTKLVKFARVLGPKGLMPNPKNGTVTADPQAALKNMTGKNTLSLKTEKDAPIVHTIVGKLSFSDTDLSENITAVLSAFTAGQIKKVVLKSTMSPAIKLQY